MGFALAAIIGYLIGGLPTGIVVCRIVKGVDPRSQGSGGMGATNVSRILGKKWAALVLLIDVLKGYLPVMFVAPLIAQGTSPDGVRLLMAAAEVAGHVWTPYAGFRGGKGVATAAGAMLALDPISLLVALAVWGVVLAATRIVSVASVIAAIAFPIAMFTVGAESVPYRVLAVLVPVFLIYTHRSNLARLMRREEKRIL